MKTLQQVLEQAESLSRNRGDKYDIIARKIRKLIELKGADCLVSDVSVEEVNAIKLVDTYI